jgi:hypothetical protein
VLVQLHLDLTGEPHIKVVEHLYVQKQNRGLGELCGDRVEEDFWAVVLVFEGLAFPGLGGLDAEVDYVGAVAEEDGFSACFARLAPRQ